MKKIIFILSTCFFLSSCQAPTTVVSRGVNTDIEKERIIMQGIALETFYNLFNFHMSSVFFISLTVNNVYSNDKKLCVFDGNKWIISNNKSDILKTLIF